jgi:hypothetical protein
LPAPIAIGTFPVIAVIGAAVASTVNTTPVIPSAPGRSRFLPDAAVSGPGPVLAGPASVCAVAAVSVSAIAHSPVDDDGLRKPYRRSGDPVIRCPGSCRPVKDHRHHPLTTAFAENKARLELLRTLLAEQGHPTDQVALVK